MTLRCQRKIISLEVLKDKLCVRGSRKLVHCHGCFDLLHPGHVHYFEFARKFGEALLVSLNSDAYFTNKGPGRPIFNEHLRAIAIASLEVVDYVCVYPGYIPEEIFHHLKPEFYVKGSEYDYHKGNPKIPEEEMVSRYGGKVIYGPDDLIFSSTELVRAVAACQTS